MATSNFTINDNDFEHTETYARVALSITILTVLYIFVILLNYGIVYYEQEVSDLHRTLINKMVAVSCVINMVLATNTIVMLNLRVILLGRVKLHPGACVVYRFVNVSSGIQLILVYNEVSWLKYIYLKHGTVGGLDDRLIATYLIIINAIIGLISGTLRILPPGSSLINIKTICHRKDYEIYGTLADKNPYC